MEFVEKMTAKLFDIEAGKLISILNETDAKQLGLMPNDRIEITNPKNRKKTVTVVDTTDSMVKEKEIGIFEDVKNLLKIKHKDVLNVKAVPQPESVRFIKKKMQGQKLTKQELKKIVHDIGNNTLSDIETSAFMSAVYIHGYDLEETVAMTEALAEDGLQLKLTKGPVLDKHCIGGINGRSTMIIVPIVAAAGFFIPKTSSRSITSAAGTADAMEVLANVSLSISKIKKIVEKVGGVIAWGGAIDLAPVDDKIIKIEHPLSLDPMGQIIASVMAKKSSVGAKFVVIDLPVGPDTKIQTREKAEEMAKKFIEVGKKLNIKVEVVITNGTEPSGRAFGPALEAKYVLEILEGKFYDNLAQRSCELAGVLFELIGRTKKGKGTALAKEILESGKALEKMKQIINAQGPKALSSKDVKLSNLKTKVFAKEDGEISKINVKKCIEIARKAGAPADKKAGLMLYVEEGQKVKKNQLLFEIFAENQRKLNLAKKYALSQNVIELEKIILEKFV